jgi:hypothetical protein
MATTKRKPPPATLVLLVRHGQTPTTGKVLPGRAAGLHLADAGREQAVRAAERIAELAQVDAVYASPLERARETAAPIATARRLKVSVDRGLLEADFGEWTGAELKALMKLPEWSTVQRYPSGFRFPGGESFPEMQQRITVGHRAPGGPPPRRSGGGGEPCRPHQGGGGRRPRHPARPVPAHRDLHVLGHRHRLRRQPVPPS